MASSKKPKGIIDDLGKQIARLMKKGTPAAKEKARKLQGIQRQYIDSASKSKAGKDALTIEWSKKLGAERYAKERAGNAKSVSQRLREEKALRGMDSKFKGQGKKQSADETGAMTSARLRAEKKKNFRESGGRNAPDRIDARKRAAENRAKNARPKPAAGGAGKGPKPPKKTGTASAPKGPKKPRNNKK
jgi:hypothetical protein